MVKQGRGAHDKAARTELEAIAEAAHHAIIGLTAEGVVRSWNPAAARLYGYAPEEIIGRSAQVLCPPDRRDEEIAFLRRITSGERVEDHRAHRRRKDGTVITVSVNASPVDDPPGAVVCATAVPAAGQTADDRVLGERSQAQRDQARQLETLGELAGGVAHDFNNLLAVILNYASFVAEELDGGGGSEGAGRLDAARRDVEEIQRAGTRAASLTRQLLAFSRREVVRPRVVDLNVVVTGVKEMLRRTLGEHIELVTSLAGDLWPVLADPGQLEQVLVNLAVNARDAMPDGGTLTIDTGNVTVDAGSVAGGSKSQVGKNVRLRVSDTGTGMPPDVAERAFEPFFTTKGPGAGTGLGLATVYGIITQADGHLRLHSEPGAGTTFSIMLPVTAEVSASVAEPERYQRVPRGESVLVVEDEDALRAVTERILTRGGYHVITAANGPEAFDAARAYPGEIHLLITDVVMPLMLGREVAEKIRAIKPGIAVLYMSGYARPVLASEGRLDPGMALVEKPFSAADLLSMAGQALNGQFEGFKTITKAQP